MSCVLCPMSYVYIYMSDHCLFLLLPFSLPKLERIYRCTAPQIWSDNLDGSGQNWLGLQLMLIRDQLQKRTVASLVWKWILRDETCELQSRWVMFRTVHISPNCSRNRHRECGVLCVSESIACEISGTGKGSWTAWLSERLNLEDGSLHSDTKWQQMVEEAAQRVCMRFLGPGSWAQLTLANLAPKCLEVRCRGGCKAPSSIHLSKNRTQNLLVLLLVLESEGKRWQVKNSCTPSAPNFLSRLVSPSVSCLYMILYDFVDIN